MHIAPDKAYRLNFKQKILKLFFAKVGVGLIISIWGFEVKTVDGGVENNWKGLFKFKHFNVTNRPNPLAASCCLPNIATL